MIACSADPRMGGSALRVLYGIVVNPLPVRPLDMGFILASWWRVIRSDGVGGPDWPSGACVTLFCRRSRLPPVATEIGASALPAGGQSLQPVGQLLADLAALAGDLLVEHQLEGIEVGLGDLEAGVVERAARRDQPA